MSPDAATVDEGWKDPWSDDELLATLRENPDIGSGAGLDDWTRFSAQITKMVRRRLAGASDLPQDLAIFLLSPSVPRELDVHELEDHPIFDSGLAPVEGALWLTAAAALAARGFRFPVGYNDAQLFTWVATDLSLAQNPAVIYDPRSGEPELRYYRRGLGTPHVCEVQSMAHMTVSLDEVRAAIGNLYKTCLVTPTAHSPGLKLWASAKDYQADSRAEEKVQASLRSFLQGWFKWCVIRFEQTQVAGRTDLEVEEVDLVNPGKLIRHVVLELKVLRSIRESGATVPTSVAKEAVREGLIQAAAYRDEKNFASAVVCCFDMRKDYSGRTCFKHVLKDASQRSVTLWVWHLFNSAKAYRQHPASL